MTLEIAAYERLDKILLSNTRTIRIFKRPGWDILTFLARKNSMKEICIEMPGKKKLQGKPKSKIEGNITNGSENSVK